MKILQADPDDTPPWEQERWVGIIKNWAINTSVMTLISTCLLWIIVYKSRLY